MTLHSTVYSQQHSQFNNKSIYVPMSDTVCDRIENSDGAEPDWDHFGRNRTGTGLQFYKPEKVNRIGHIFNEFFKTLTLNLQVIVAI